MMTPLQITTQHFTPNGKGGYKASEVDAFMQKVSKFYGKLYNDNKALNEKLTAISPIIDEYNRNKAAIANALISAQTAADAKIQQANAAVDAAVAEANAKGDAIMEAKILEAEKYYSEKTKDADAKLLELEKSYTALKAQSDEFREKYIAEVNQKVDEIINDANEKASVIVAKAYEDAKLARERADKIIEQANAELSDIMAKSEKIRAELAEIVLAASKFTETKEFAPLETVESAQEDIKAEELSADDMPEFDLDAIEAASEADEAEKESNPINEDDIVIYQKKDFKVNLPNEEITESVAATKADEKPEKAKIPDVNSYLAKIFNSVEGSDSDFSFDDLISENK